VLPTLQIAGRRDPAAASATAPPAAAAAMVVAVKMPADRMIAARFRGPLK